MELAQHYIQICRTDPLRMHVTINKTKETIEQIIEMYSNNLSVTYRLMMDLKEIVSNYLIKNNLYDLFAVTLHEVSTGWAGSKINVELKYTYNEERKLITMPGVFPKFKKGEFR